MEQILGPDLSLSCPCYTTFIWSGFSIFIEIKRVHFQRNWLFSWFLFFKYLLISIIYSCCRIVFIYCRILFRFQSGKGCSRLCNNLMSHLHIFKSVFDDGLKLYFRVIPRNRLRETIVRLSEGLWTTYFWL